LIELTLTNVDRVLWPETGFTKGGMIDYYRDIAPVLLPHLLGRPLTLGRFPTGVDQKGWYQTNCRGAPSWMRVAEIPASRGDQVFRMCVVDDLDSLVWVANQGTVELHPYLSLADAFDEPVVLVFDLDPGEGATLAECCAIALLVRERLLADGLRVLPKTSGSRGLHVYAGLAAGATFPSTRAYARSVAAELASTRPDRVTDGFTHAQRAGRVLIDWRQNERGRSQVAPYSLRATPWPFVSTPLAWSEVEEAASSGDGGRLFFSPAEALARVRARGDLFASIAARENRLPANPESPL
jgi:bifunctional non-homologous end joining protein LigD